MIGEIAGLTDGMLFNLEASGRYIKRDREIDR